MTRGEVWATGLGQCVSWGVMYYAFGVLVVPIESELGVARSVVVGAFSVALLMSAVTSPHVGRLVDRGQGPFVVLAGGLAAVALLAMWARPQQLARAAGPVAAAALADVTGYGVVFGILAALMAAVLVVLSGRWRQK